MKNYRNFLFSNKLLTLALLTLAAVKVTAQDGTLVDPTNSQTRASSAALEVYSTNQGFLAPRVSLTQTTVATPVTSPAIGLLVFNTNPVNDVVVGYYYWNGTSWQRLINGNGTFPTGSGTLNYVAKWTPDGTTLGNSQLFDNGTNVGIGTNAPFGKLEVLSRQGGTNGSAVVGLAHQMVLGGAYNTAPNTSGVKLWIGDYDNDGSTVYPIYMEDENNFVDFWIRSRPTEALLPTLYFAGNAGIGTNAPVQRLEVNGKTVLHDGGTTYVNPAAAEVQIGYRLAPANSVGEVARLALQPYGHGGGPFIFYNRDDASNAYLDLRYGATSATASLVSVIHSGNVGIGTSSPSRKLELYGTAPGIKINDPNGSGNSYVELSTVDGGLSYFQNIGGRTRIHVGGAERMTFLNNGNVGINSATPAHRLDVVGNVNAEHLVQGPLVAHPKATWSVGGGSTGAVIIKLPGTTANYGMLHIEIDVYEYGTTGATTFILGGHNWNGQWYNYTCSTIGTSTKKVRLAVKDGQYAIVIGEQGSAWSYGHVVLSKITNGGYYSGIIDLAGTYTLTQDNSAESYTWITGDLNSQSNPSMTTNYIQNQVASDQTAGFRINGNGLFNGGSVGIGSLSPGWKLDVNGNARIGANASQNTLAALAVSAGQGSGTTFRDIDLHGNWNSGEGHAISASHATGANNLVGQIVFEHNSPGSRIKFGRLYHGGDQTTYPMELVSNGSNAILRMNSDAYTYYGPNSSWGAYLQVGGNGRVTTSASVAATNGNLHLDAADGGFATYINYYSQNPTYINAQAGNIGLGTTGTFDKVTVNGRIRFGTNDVSYTNPGTGATFGTGDPTQGIGWGNQPLDEYGIWVAPQENVYGNYTRLILGWHTGVKIGGSSGYGGTRFYNNSPVYAGSNATEIFSVGNGDNNVRALYGMYSPIYYDYNDAGYYVDPASTSNLNLITDRTRATMGNSALYNTPRHQITSDTRYWTGAMGWGTTDLNDVANWGSGFIDSWSSPGNGPGTTSHYVGHQAFHFAGGGTYNYGYQMVSTTNNNRWHLRSNWNSGWSPWVEMLTTGNATTLYPNIGGDNLGNHSATTTLTMNGNNINSVGDIFATQNYGMGLVGVYDSYRYQNVFAMGPAYRLSADGTSTSNMYGLAWTHSNAGGQSKSGLGHQLLAMSAGVTTAAMGNGFWTNYPSYLRYIYDTDNTGYYLDPNGASNTYEFYRYYGFNGPEYDGNNGAYYVDPNGSTYMNYMGRNYGWNWTEYDWNNSGYYTDLDQTSNVYAFYRYYGFNGPEYDGNNGAYYIDPNGSTYTNYMGRNYGWNWTEYDWNNSAYYMDLDQVSIVNDMRARIFYDYDNTNYYTDPAGVWYAGRFNGYVVASSPYYVWSSETGKDNISVLTANDFASAYSLLDTMKLYNYNYTDPEKDHRTQIGLIAETAPEPFSSPERDAVAFSNVVWFNTAAIKHLGKKIENLEKQITKLNDFGVATMSETEKWVSFSSDFKALIGNSMPVVVVTPSQSGIDLSISEVTKEGFIAKTISGNSTFSFSWIAMAELAKNDEENSNHVNSKMFAEMMKPMSEAERKKHAAKGGEPAIKIDPAAAEKEAERVKIKPVALKQPENNNILSKPADVQFAPNEKQQR